MKNPRLMIENVSVANNGDVHFPIQDGKLWGGYINIHLDGSDNVSANAWALFDREQILEMVKLAKATAPLLR